MAAKQVQDAEQTVAEYRDETKLVQHAAERAAAAHKKWYPRVVVMRKAEAMAIATQDEQTRQKMSKRVRKKSIAEVIIVAED